MQCGQVEGEAIKAPVVVLLLLRGWKFELVCREGSICGGAAALRGSAGRSGSQEATAAS